MKVFSQVFFKKLAGLGSAHKNGAFFLPSFFFAPLVPKKKRYYEFYNFYAWKTFFKKKAFFPQTPIFKEIATGVWFFFLFCAFDVCIYYFFRRAGACSRRLYQI